MDCCMAQVTRHANYAIPTCSALQLSWVALGCLMARLYGYVPNILSCALLCSYQLYSLVMIVQALKGCDATLHLTYPYAKANGLHTVFLLFQFATSQ